ncbi:MAG: hypothetical protein ACO1QB_03575 [Verrucomicrobiales bacterium]
MNKADELLDKLFVQARRASEQGTGSNGVLNKGLENRILAEWRRTPSEESLNLVPILRWGFGFALSASLVIIAASAMAAQGNSYFAPTVQAGAYTQAFYP